MDFPIKFQKGKEKKDTTVLHEAISESAVQSIKYILTTYPELKDSKDGDENTPLHIAVMTDFPRAVTLLLSQGADRLIKNNAGKTPVDLAEEQRLQDPNLLKAFEGTYTDSL